MKPECSAESWLGFFSQAGIPTEAAEDYAITFSQNQIQLDMLPDIKKEYLNDMGITLMGHIIAILRHAKTVYQDEIKKTELPSKIKQPLSVPKQKPIVSRPVVITPDSSSSQPTKVLPTIEVLPSLPSPISKRKNTIISLKSSDDSEPNVKVRKTLPEPASFRRPPGYVSSEEFTKRKTAGVVIYEEGDSSKKGIFKRLGTEVNPPCEPEASASVNSSMDSVFSRLGGKLAYNSSPLKTKSATVAQDSNECNSTPATNHAKKGIIRSRLESKPKILVSPSYMDGEREDRDLASRFNNTWPTSLARDKRGIRERLGTTISLQKPSMDKAGGGGGGGNVGKRVSFGSVYEKLIPRDTAPKVGVSSLGLNFNPRHDYSTQGSLGLSSGVFSRLGL